MSLWREHNDPRPVSPSPPPADFEGSRWDADGVEASIEACRDPGGTGRGTGGRHPRTRAAEVLFWRNLTPAAFSEFPPLYLEVGEREPFLDLPTRPEDHVGAALPPGYG